MATIVIDPGHYAGYNTGVCPNYNEGSAMLQLANYLGAALTNMGAAVKYTRTSDTENPTLAQRGSMAQGADLFISLHTDASDNANARGVTVYNSVQRPNSEAFASFVGEAAADAMGNQFRGTVARPSQTRPGQDYLGVLRTAVATGVPHAFLVEHGFHTNPEDCAVLNSSEGLQRIANAEARAIGDYFGLNTTTPPTSTCCRFYYTVQPGEYLFLIGQKFGVSWEELARVNGINAPYPVTPGQRLIIPLQPAPC